MKRLLSLTAVALSTAFICETASAQDPTWLNDRQYREGSGFRVGDFELHPGIGADFGYDSNYFRRSGGAEEVIGALRLRISPHFAVSTLSPQRRDEDAEPPSVNFRFEVGATYNEFFPVSGSDAQQSLLQDQRNIGVASNVILDILPEREWSGNIHGGVGRSVRPTNEGDLSTSFNRVTPSAGAELIWRPDSGLLDWRLGYDFAGTFFEAGAFDLLNNYRNDISTRGRWRFLPRTALLYDASFSFVTYPSPAGIAPKSDSHPLRSRIGVNGLVTPAFSVLALVGWGASFYADTGQEDFDSLLAQLELKWFLNPGPQSPDPMQQTASISAIAVGFIRDYEDSYVGSYLERDQGYARFNYLFGGAFLLHVETRAGGVFFPNAPAYGQPNGWSDFRFDAQLFGEYRATDWLGINVDLEYTGYFSETTLQYLIGQDELKYQQFTGFLGARVFF